MHNLHYHYKLRYCFIKQLVVDLNTEVKIMCLIDTKTGLHTML